MYVFAIRLAWFPVISRGVTLRSVVLPSLTLAIAMSAKYLRQVRAAVLEELGKGVCGGCKGAGRPLFGDAYQRASCGPASSPS